MKMSIDFFYNCRYFNRYDVNMIRLREPIEFSEWVQPVCLFGAGTLKEKDKVTLLGYGPNNDDRYDKPADLREVIIF